MRFHIVHERRVALSALAAGLPAVVVAMVLLWKGDITPKVQWTLTLLIAASWFGFTSTVRERVAIPLRTLANLLEAMREGDYSIRARAAAGEDALGDVMEQVNEMAATLRNQRLGALEATTLLRKVMEEINVAVFAFDADHKLRLVNKAGQRLLGQPIERLMNAPADSVGLDEFLKGEPVRTIQRAFASGGAVSAGSQGRWGISRSVFREGGLPHQLLVISDLTRPLRDEELQAWQRLVRVLGHELNNSLTPIKSIAGSLESLLTKDPLPEDWRDDTRRGLGVIASRSESLNRFMGSYARLAKLPRPDLAPIDLGPLVERVAKLETRLSVKVAPGPRVTLEADRDQLEQVLINLIRNGADASKETNGGVTIGWDSKGPNTEIWIRDEGPGLANTANLFVPFFTTKPGGSGIGLVLCRQVIEAHGGSLSLRNVTGGRGCEARVILPG